MEATTRDSKSELEARIEELQSQLLQAQKMTTVGELAASTTHEFNNILMTVINYAKMGLRHTDVAIREKAFNRILSAGQRANKITTGMLAFARSKGDQRDQVDLTQVVTEVLILCEKDLQMNQVKLQTDFLGHPICDINIAQIQQVLLNMIVNARQSMTDGGRLFLTIRESDDGTMGEIIIRDTGSGIPAETLRKIFEPFFTTKQTDSNGQGGTGLGLSFCRDVIESHKGRLRVESTLGEGTTFMLRFPIAIAESERKSA
jgi:signal transduction histidine kinase